MEQPLPVRACVEQLYEDYLVDQDSAAFVSGVRQRYTAGTLERLVASSERRTRRAAVLALGLIGDYSCNAVLGRALSDSDRLTRCLAENGIRGLWLRDGEAFERQQLGVLVRLNAAQHYQQALRQANDFIERSPAIAEGWNQRAIALYCLGRYEESIADCRAALDRNAYHFGAAGGMGQCYVHLDQLPAALESFRRALALNPNLEGVRASINYLEPALER